MMIVGGKNEATLIPTPGYSTSATVVMSDGTQCTTTLPDLPKKLEGFGMASRKNRYAYVCGGVERDETLGKKNFVYRKIAAILRVITVKVYQQCNII